MQLCKYAKQFKEPNSMMSIKFSHNNFHFFFGVCVFVYMWTWMYVLVCVKVKNNFWELILPSYHVDLGTELKLSLEAGAFPCWAI